MATGEEREAEMMDINCCEMGTTLDGFDPIPVLELMEREMIYTGEEQTKMYQAYKGQLKLSVYINCGLLTIHVIQARHLSAKYKGSCDAYVRLSLVPDDNRRTRCKTEVIHDTNRPVFDEKFSFELLEEDLQKRLLISVWNKDQTKGRSEFLGCTSFGVCHFKDSKRSVSGWYYLLTEDVGKRKHLKVVTRRTRNVHGKPLSPVLPSINKDLLWMDTHTLLLKRGLLQGFGFSVTGSAPTQVCKVEEGSAAMKAKLMKDDCIIRVNGQNVSRSTCDSVARLVRHSRRQVILEIQRPHQVETMDKSPWRPGVSTSTAAGTTWNPPSASTPMTYCPSTCSTTSEEDSPPPLRLEDLKENTPASLDSYYQKTQSNHLRGLRGIAATLFGKR